MVRSVDLYSFYIAYASVKERKGDRLFLRDPANARDVPAGPLVAPPSRVHCLGDRVARLGRVYRICACRAVFRYIFYPLGKIYKDSRIF